MPLRRYVVTWSRRFSDGRQHQVRDVILATSRKRAAAVVILLYGKRAGFVINDVHAQGRGRSDTQAPTGSTGNRASSYNRNARDSPR